MAGILTNFSNLGVLIGSLYPTFIVCFLVLASIFNLKLTGLVYLFGIIVTVAVCFLIAQTGIVAQRPPNAPISCDLFNIGNTVYKGPSTQAAISWFTFIYLLWPMIPPAQSSSIPNPMVIAATASLALINNVFQWRNGCASMPGILLGIVLGIGLGTAWFWMWWLTDHKDLLFYNELISNNAICRRPARQTFKCEVWKGGELVSQSTI